MQITAAVIEEKDAAFDLIEVELDEHRSDEMVMGIVTAGMCHSDLSVPAASGAPLAGLHAAGRCHQPARPRHPAARHEPGRQQCLADRPGIAASSDHPARSRSLAALLASHMVGTIWMPQPLAVAARCVEVSETEFAGEVQAHGAPVRIERPD
jgi:hypothetical protein